MDMGETGTDTPLAQARRMLDIFASVGAERFHVTWTNADGNPRRSRSLRSSLRSLGGPLPQPENEDWLDAIHIARIGAADLNRTLPALLETAAADQLNLNLRPYADAAWFIQLDDISADTLARCSPAMFLQIETSPGNHQAWLALRGRHDRELACRVRRGAGTDITASGATKIAGIPELQGQVRAGLSARHDPCCSIPAASPASMSSIGLALSRRRKHLRLPPLPGPVHTAPTNGRAMPCASTRRRAIAPAPVPTAAAPITGSAFSHNNGGTAKATPPIV